jgi:hypothetical protein
MHISMTKGDNLVSGMQPSLLFKTIKRDQLLEIAISSSYLLSTKLPNSEQSSKGKVKTHKYIN